MKKSMDLSALTQDILTALGSRELFGLELLNEININRSKQLGVGSLYPTLSRLEEKELIESRWSNEEDETNGGRRKYYKMTSKGAIALTEVQQYRDRMTQRAKLNYSTKISEKIVDKPE